jgi:hypothetical protein
MAGNASGSAKAAQAPEAKRLTMTNYWDLKGNPGMALQPTAPWELLSQTFSGVAEKFNKANEAVGVAWTGPIADNFRMHHLKLWPDTLDCARIARRMSERFEDIAGVTRSAQEHLDAEWRRLRNRVTKADRDQDTAYFTVRSQAEEFAIVKSMKNAMAIREHADGRLKGISQAVADDLNKVYALMDKWAQVTDGGAADWNGGAVTTKTTIVQVGNQVHVTRGAGVGVDDIRVSTDPQTGEHIVYVNGEPHRYPPDTVISVHDGALSATSGRPPVASYSPYEGIRVDRVGDDVRITANLVVTGEDATPEKAKEIEDRIRRAWSGNFGDGTTVRTNVSVTYLPPGTPVPDGTATVLLEKILGPSHMSRLTGDVTINTSKPHALDAIGHEFGHQIGLRDRYTESIASRISGEFGGERHTPPIPGHETNIMAARYPVKSENVRDLSVENAPDPGSTDDQIRDWVTRSDAGQMAALATPTKVKMANELMSGWVSDQDVGAIEILCRTARPGAQSDALREAIGPWVDRMWSDDQRTRIQEALKELR